MPSYELLMTDSLEKAQQLVSWLEKKNTERQQLTRKAVAEAREQVFAQGVLPLLMVSDERCPAGISGLVAGRLAEEFYRPAVVVSLGKRVCSGSCRSIPEFNIIEALSRCGDIFSQFGGHAQAAGFIVPTRNLSLLHDRLLEMAVGQLVGVDLRPRLDIDAETTLSTLTGDTYESIRRLAPFGQGNPLPTFLSRRVEVVDSRTMGNNGDHIRLKVRQEGSVWDAVGFGMGPEQPKVNDLIDIVHNLEVDHWGGQATLRLNMLDFAPAD